MTGAGLGESALRPDGAAKAAGEFLYGGDLAAEGMLWGATVRSPHPHARLVELDLEPARRLAGPAAVIAAGDVPGRLTYGQKLPDQPVFVDGVARYHGEVVAAVAAATPQLARAAAAAVVARWEPLAPLTDPHLSAGGPAVHPLGNVLGELRMRCGDPDAEGPVVIEGEYCLGMQDQVFLAPEAGLAVPLPGAGVRLHVASQSLHNDRAQIAACLDLTPDHVQVVQAGVGGAFGGREELTLHVPVCLLALRTGRPVKMLFDRAESFLAHAHRHPARVHYRHTATADGRLVSVQARFLLDGGAYTGMSPAVLKVTVATGAGPYAVPNVCIAGTAVRTNNPPAGAMRGFGAVQSCVGYEAQMDRLAAAVGLDPLELRRRNALRTGMRMPTGQLIEGSAPTLEVLDRLAAIPLPAAVPGSHPEAPGGYGDCADPARIRRGVGMAFGFKSVIFTSGHNVPATAAVTLRRGARGPQAVVRSAAAEVGQGFVTIAGQIVRTELGVEDVVFEEPTTALPSSGPSGASRQSWMSGAALQLACRAIRDQLGGRPVAELPADHPISAERTYMHEPTEAADADGQGRLHVAWTFVAHRAVVDVDIDLGTVRLVQLVAVGDVGRALNPAAVHGQLEGGSVQGAGLALTEEMAIAGGRVLAADLGDYLIPTAVDVPWVVSEFVEVPEPASPLGAKGIGEAPAVTSTAAVAAALRDATGLPVRRLPARPEDLVPALAGQQISCPGTRPFVRQTGGA